MSPFKDKPRLITGLALAVAAITIGWFMVAHHDAPNQRTRASQSTPQAGTNTMPTIPSAETGAPVKAAVATEALDGATASANSLKDVGNAIAGYVNVHDQGSSIYLEDLDRHIAVHVGETKAYNIKSLMKVPLIMSLYKAAKLQRLSLDDTITLSPSEIDKEFGDLWKKGAGYQLTLHDAAKLALQHSDNTAIRAINDHVFAVMAPEERAYKVIDLDLRVDDKGDSFISTTSYSTVFRCLYTACYNDRQDSDEMLDLMKHSEFSAPSQLLPDGVQVAHKIGSVDGVGFNDCGIMYGPKTPLMFCIMLNRGQPQADTDIATIAKLAYDNLEK